MTRSPGNVGSGGSVSESSMSQTLRAARQGSACRPLAYSLQACSPWRPQDEKVQCQPGAWHTEYGRRWPLAVSRCLTTSYEESNLGDA